MPIVVAHRSPAVRARMRDALLAVGMEAVDPGSDPLRAVRDLRPDVALVDDLALVREIASDPDLLGTSVVLVGGETSVEAALDALGRGAHDVLPDPPRDAELVARVRAAERAAALRGQLLARDATLEGLAFSDDLTGLWNRRFMARRLSSAIRAAERHDRPLSVALVDIDRFKDVNDLHGHAVGDTVLVAVAARLRGAVREEDEVGRWGGEEFVVILPDEGEQGALAAANRLRESVGGHPVDAGGLSVPVTVSVGCGTHMRGESIDDVLRRADQALYGAKGAGRNAVRSPGR